MRSVRLVSTLLIVVALVTGAPVAASASESVSAASLPAADPPDFTPSPNKWQAWMLNVTGKVLGGAMPDKWRAEQLANQYRYNHSWDLFAAQHGYSANSRDVNGNLSPIPKPGSGTYDDYVIEEYEKQVSKGGTKDKPLAAPSTKTQKLTRTVGGALAAYTGFEIGSMLGAAGTNLVGGWFGFDPQGAVCAGTGDDLGGTMIQMLSGQDCSAFALDEEYQMNQDGGLSYGPLVYGSYSLSVNGKSVMSGGAKYTCVTRSGSAPSGYVLEIRSSSDGAWGQTGANFGIWSSCQVGTSDISTGFAFFAGYRLKNLNTSAVVAEDTGAAGDPQRQFDCEVTMTDGTVSSSLSDLFTEASGMLAQPICPEIPDGKTPESVAIDMVPGPGAPPEVLPDRVYEQDVTPEYADWWDNYPECRTGACKLDLYVGTGSAIAASCFDLEDGCQGWHTDPNKATNYTCRYGVHDVGLDECNVYAGLFEPGRITAGASYSDPMTGEWSGGATSPRLDGQAMAQTIQDPEVIRACDGLSSMGFDPVAWVMRPVQCAMEWAAIPKPTVAAVAFAGVTDVWAEKPPGAIAAAVDSMTLAGGATGCSISTTFKGVTTPLVDACGGFMGGLATFTRLVTTALMAVLVFGQVRRQIAAMVNYNVGQG
ncbi:MAG: hypothetical protein Q7T59_06225 [Candidatus Woesebacteria bacterium]|nr:hypothetical protein [Candidatus Woesebacteria bacterium]